MLHPKNLIQVSFLFSLVFSQGPLNSFGIGNYQRWSSPSQGGIGSIGLVPSFQNQISLSNPATWSNLKYTHLSVSYNGLESKINKSKANNSFSNLQSAQLIIPIKQKYSLGIELHPYAYQQVILADTLYENILVFDDTISIKKEYEQAGGIMAFDLSMSASLFKGNDVGLTMQLLFGSSRQNNSLVLNQIPYSHTSRLNYSGVNTIIYISQKSSFGNFYFKSSLSLNPLEAIHTKMYPYDDTNNNGYHDFTYSLLNPGYDFPHPNDIPSPTESRITSIHDKSSVGIGLSKNILNRIQISGEFERSKDHSSFDIQLPNSFNYRIKSNENISFGFIWYPNDLSYNFIDNFTFRSGIAISNISFDEYDFNTQSRIDNKNDITQFGYTIGFGYKFKNVGNQIDFTYYSGFRDYPDIYGDEKLRQFQIGLNIADIWFIKRRQR
tara:strand:- start:385 stop:1698 length:1314 start_codon:yes stop_codon:yes gene_type:complete